MTINTFRRALTAMVPSLIVFGIPFLVAAATSCAPGADGFVPLACVTEQSSKLSGLYSSTDLAGFVNGIFKFAIALGATAAVLRLAYAGFLYMGTDMWSKKGQAKQILQDVTFGLLLLLSVWLILNQINPHLLDLNVLRNISSTN